VQTDGIVWHCSPREAYWKLYFMHTASNSVQTVRVRALGILWLAGRLMLQCTGMLLLSG
jgi:hypothetical protein